MRKTALAVALAVFLAPAAALPQTKSGKSGVYEQLNLSARRSADRHDAVKPTATASRADRDHRHAGRTDPRRCT